MGSNPILRILLDLSIYNDINLVQFIRSFIEFDDPLSEDEVAELSDLVDAVNAGGGSWLELTHSFDQKGNRFEVSLVDIHFFQGLTYYVFEILKIHGDSNVFLGEIDEDGSEVVYQVGDQIFIHEEDLVHEEF